MPHMQAAVASAAELVDELTQPGLQLYNNYVRTYETKQEQALKKHSKLACKSRTNARRANVIQQAVAAASAAGFGDKQKQTAKCIDEETDINGEEADDDDDDVGRSNGGLVEFVQQLTNPGLPDMPTWQTALMAQPGDVRPLSQPFTVANKPVTSSPSIVTELAPAPIVQATKNKSSDAVPTVPAAARQSLDLRSPGSPIVSKHATLQAARSSNLGVSSSERIATGQHLTSNTNHTGTSNLPHTQNQPLAQHTGTKRGHRSTEHTNEGMRRLHTLLGPGTSLSLPQCTLEAAISPRSSAGSPPTTVTQHGRRAGSRASPRRQGLTPMTTTNLSRSLPSGQTSLAATLSPAAAHCSSSTANRPVYTPSMLTATALASRRSLTGRSTQQALHGCDPYGGAAAVSNGKGALMSLPRSCPAVGPAAASAWWAPPGHKTWLGRG